MALCVEMMLMLVLVLVMGGWGGEVDQEMGGRGLGEGGVLKSIGGEEDWGGGGGGSEGGDLSDVGRGEGGRDGVWRGSG